MSAETQGRALTVADRAPMVGDVLFVDEEEAVVVDYQKPTDLYMLRFVGGSRDIWSGHALRNHLAEFLSRADAGPITTTAAPDVSASPSPVPVRATEEIS